VGWTYGVGLSRSSHWPAAPWESVMLVWAHGVPLPGWLDRLMLYITYIGTNLTVLPVVLLVGVWLWRAHGKLVTWIHLLVVTGGSLSLNAAMKSLLDRERPDLFPLRGMYQWASFPSGHAVLTVAFYFTVALQLRGARGWRWPFLAALAIVLATAFSRLYLAVHWPTDVLGGMLIGLVWLAGSWISFTRYIRDTRGEGAVIELDG
jgi:undecaprenyl-diphosphatase